MCLILLYSKIDRMQDTDDETVVTSKIYKMQVQKEKATNF